MWYRKVVKIGNSLHVGIPARVARQLGLEQGETVLVYLGDEGVLIRKDVKAKAIRTVMSKTRGKTGEKDHG